MYFSFSLQGAISLKKNGGNISQITLAGPVSRFTVKDKGSTVTEILYHVD